MKVLFILLLLAPFANGQGKFNQTDAQGRKQGPWKETWPKNTVKKYEGQFKDDKPFGTFKFWHENGKMRAVMKYSNRGTVSRVEFFNERGKLMARGKYVNKQKDSTWVHYARKDVVSYVETYKKGKLEGERIVYYVGNVSNSTMGAPTGVVYIKEHYRNGMRHGTYTEFHPDGSKRGSGEYVDGNKEGRFEYYYPNGKREKIETYKFAVKHGLFMLFSEEGKEIGKLFYQQGELLEGKKLEEYLSKGKASGR